MDNKRQVAHLNFSVTTGASTRWQLFNSTGLIFIKRGFEQNNRIGNSVTLKEINVNFRLTGSMQYNLNTRQESIAMSTTGRMNYREDSLSLQTPTYDASTGGFKATIEGEVIEAFNQIPIIGNATTTYPNVEALIHRRLPDTFQTDTAGYYQNASFTSPFVIPRVWKIRYGQILRVMVLRGGYIFDPAQVRGDLFFDTANTYRNPYNGVNIGTHIPVLAHLKNLMYERMEVVLDKVFHLDDNMEIVYRFSLPCEGQVCQWRENAIQPTFNNYNIAPLSLIAPLQNNYVMLTMSDPICGCNNFTDIFSEPTFGVVPVGFFFDTEVEVIYNEDAMV